MSTGAQSRVHAQTAQPVLPLPRMGPTASQSPPSSISRTQGQGGLLFKDGAVAERAKFGMSAMGSSGVSQANFA